MTKVTRKGKAAAAAAAAAGSGRSKHTAPQVTAAQLFQQAQIALRFDDFDAAKDALRKAVRLEPGNGALLDAYACLLAELSDDGAQEALVQAVAAAPTSGHEKYMYLAQLEDDPNTALQYSSQGLALLQARLEAARAAPSQQSEARALARALCGALCGHAEMLLGQACMAREQAAGVGGSGAGCGGSGSGPDPRSVPLDAGLVAQIEAALARASELQPQSPEPGQALAALLSEQGRGEAALAALRTSMNLWWDPEDSEEEEDEEQEEHGMQEDEQPQVSMAMDADEPQGGPSSQTNQQPTRAGQQGQLEEGEEEEEEEEDDTPSFEFRFECAKLLLELDDSTDTAVGVLSSLVEEHDSNPDAWHLLALALYSGHQYEEALEVVVKGQELLRKLRVPRKDDAWSQFAELQSAINEAAGNAAAAAGAAGIKSGF